MGENKGARGAAALLILLALASFAMAAITITNITEWVIKAKDAPIVKVKGSDLEIQSDYIQTSIEWEIRGDYTNRTIITLVGFKGDPTKYDEVLKICNKDTKQGYYVNLVYMGILDGQLLNTVRYVNLTLTYNRNISRLKITQDTPEGSQGDSWIYLDAAIDENTPTCAKVSAEILVHPDASTDVELVRLWVDVVSRTPQP